MLSLTAIGVFVLAVLLHALWDVVNSLGVSAAFGLVIVIVGNVAIAAGS